VGMGGSPSSSGTVGMGGSPSAGTGGSPVSCPDGLAILAPSATLPLGPYTGSIGLNYGNTGLAIPFSFNNISNAMGDLQVTVVDENTYYGTNKTGLANANVSLLNPFDGSTVVSGVSDATGNISFLGVREGAYNLQVTAAKHDGYRATVMVSPGKLNTQTVFVRTQLVTYNWQVQNIDVEDRTNITLQTTFTTTVPVPVVTIDPGVIDRARLSEIVRRHHCETFPLALQVAQPGDRVALGSGRGKTAHGGAFSHGSVGRGT